MTLIEYIKSLNITDAELLVEYVDIVLNESNTISMNAAEIFPKQFGIIFKEKEKLLFFFCVIKGSVYFCNLVAKGFPELNGHLTKHYRMKIVFKKCWFYQMFKLDGRTQPFEENIKLSIKKMRSEPERV